VVVRTLGRHGMLRLEIFQIFLVSFVLRRFLVVSQFRIVLFLCSIGLSLACFPLFSRQDLPSFTDDLGDFSEGQFLAL
jgi:hypothetical protein